jgi:RND family efflux transporter MFP subunit
MNKYLLIAISIFSLLSNVSCDGKGSAEVINEAEESSHENPNTTTLTEEQIKSIGIELGVIENKQLTASLKTNGVLKVPNQNKASINSVYRGVIKSLHVQPGNTVRKGQLIATVANPEFVQVQSDYLNISAKIELAELEVKRQKELNAGNAGALKNLQAAETELRTLRTAKSTIEQQIRLMGINPAVLSNGNLISVISIKSPIIGVVSDVKVEIGSYIDVSTTIAEIVDNSQLHLDLFVYEKDLPKIKNNQLIHFTLTNNPGKEYDAQIYSLGSSFEGESKAVTVHALVQGDKSGLIDGMNITAVTSLKKATVPSVPSDAVVTIAGQDYIFVLTEEHAESRYQPERKDSIRHGGKENNEHGNEKELTFEKIPVAKGTMDVGFTEITLLKDIPKNAKVVVKGAFFVLAKMTNSGEHGH